MQTNDSTLIRLGLLINILAVLAFLILILRALQPATTPIIAQAIGPGNGGRGAGMGGGMGMRMGNGSAMMRFHQAEVPAPYAGMSSPIAADQASLARGQTAYETYCVACHGEQGMGDGLAGQALDPAPAPIAQSSQMMPDDYLFWRMSEGGAHFSTAMPAWEAALAEETRWDLVNYIRSLGAGQMVGRGIAGSNTLADPAADLAAAGVAQGVIVQAEADTFLTVHALVEEQIAAQPAAQGIGTMVDRQTAALASLVEATAITQAEADTFITVRDRLLEAGLTQ